MFQFSRVVKSFHKEPINRKIKQIQNLKPESPKCRLCWAPTPSKQNRLVMQVFFLWLCGCGGPKLRINTFQNKTKNERIGLKLYLNLPLKQPSGWKNRAETAVEDFYLKFECILRWSLLLFALYVSGSCQKTTEQPHVFIQLFIRTIKRRQKDATWTAGRRTKQMLRIVFPRAAKTRWNRQMLSNVVPSPSTFLLYCELLVEMSCALPWKPALLKLIIFPRGWRAERLQHIHLFQW